MENIQGSGSITVRTPLTVRFLIVEMFRSPARSSKPIFHMLHGMFAPIIFSIIGEHMSRPRTIPWGDEVAVSSLHNNRVVLLFQRSREHPFSHANRSKPCCERTGSQSGRRKTEWSDRTLGIRSLGVPADRRGENAECYPCSWQDVPKITPPLLPFLFI